MSAFTESPSSVPLVAYVSRALADLEALMGLEASELPGEQRDGSLVVSIRSAWGPTTRNHGPMQGLNVLCRTRDAFRIRAPAEKHPHDGTKWGADPDWRWIRDQWQRERTLLLYINLARAHWDAFARPRAEALLRASGVTLAQEVWHAPEIGEAWLLLGPRLGWPEDALGVATLLAQLVRFNGGPPLEFAVASTPPAKKDRRGPAFEVTYLVTRAKAPTVSERHLEEFVNALDVAASSAPRGFVGLKVFKERLLPLAATADDRQQLIDAAVAAGIARVREVTDPKTEALTKALELDREHELVRLVLSRRREGPAR